MVGIFIIIAIVVFWDGRSVVDIAQNILSPTKSCSAKVIAKRVRISRGWKRENDPKGSATWEIYYVTFQLQNEHRIESRVAIEEYEMLPEGDVGELTCQGNWYRGFERDMGER